MKLVVSELSKTYERFNKGNPFFIVNNLSFTINEREIYALVGQNGAGKTTTIKCILKFTNYKKGKIDIEDGESINTLMKQSKIGYFPEALSFPNLITLREFLYDLCVLRGMDKKQSMEDIIELTTKLGLYQFLDKNVSKFSKGMKKKVGFIQSILNKPKLIILDEPTDGLDPVSRKQVLNCIREISDEGSMVIITSHILSDLELICDKVGFLKEGKIISEINVKDKIRNGNLDIKVEFTDTCNNVDIRNVTMDNEIDITNNTKMKLVDIKNSGTTLEQWYYNVLLNEEKNNVESSEI